MNDNIANRIQCPFYVAHNSGTGNNITITCERIKTNMGFNVKNKLFFANQKQRLDFMELNCPYYEVIYNNKYREC